MKIIQTPTVNGRIELVDALRGFALMGILLLHNVDHFDIGWEQPSETAHRFMAAVDDSVTKAIIFLFGGKSYAIFAMLFGFSFFIQFRNAASKNRPYAGRFVWRMILLIGFGFLHVIFYSGEILSCYAVAGLVLLPLRNLDTKPLLIIAGVLMLEPWELGRIMYAALNPDWQPVVHYEEYYLHAIGAATEQDSFWVMAKANITSGMKCAHIFAWDSGRYFQTVSLFITGLLLGRHGLFLDSPRNRKSWKIVLVSAAVFFVPLYLAKIYLPSAGLRAGFENPLMVVAEMWSNLAFMAVLVSGFSLVWFYSGRLRRVEFRLTTFGRMSLTNYIFSSIIGSFIYYRWGLGLFSKAGPFYSLLIGITVFLSLAFFSRWWLSSHRQGPLERLWGRLTWIGNKK